MGNVLKDCSTYISVLYKDPNKRGRRVQGSQIFERTSALALAEQLTARSERLLIRITALDILLYHKTPLYAKDLGLTVALDKYVESFNELSMWLTSMVVLKVSEESRAFVIQHLIQLAIELRALLNFNDLMAVLSALNHAAVLRLKKSWALVTADHLEILKKLESEVSPMQNFSEYRKIVANVNMDEACIPLLQVAVKDMVFADEVPKKTGSGNLNFQKAYLFMDIVSKVRTKQPYNIIEDDLISSLQLGTYMGEKQLYNVSLMAEPRDGSEGRQMLKRWAGDENKRLKHVEKERRDTQAHALIALKEKYKSTIK